MDIEHHNSSDFQTEWQSHVVTIKYNYWCRAGISILLKRSDSPISAVLRVGFLKKYYKQSFAKTCISEKLIKTNRISIFWILKLHDVLMFLCFLFKTNRIEHMKKTDEQTHLLQNTFKTNEIFTFRLLRSVHGPKAIAIKHWRKHMKTNTSYKTLLKPMKY